MPLLPIAAFLAGALLSLLVPVALLIALSFWYMLFVRRIPEPLEGEEAVAPDAPPSRHEVPAPVAGEEVARGPISGDPPGPPSGATA